ncbi:MAG: hypothetical protein DI555_07030 [Novosphingobium pentaromativorans]|uniref:DUF3168 domain-containing protein n=1 Tax=Novosphingobium pentaromativorans TaxID=205844 RepID=A0A2W5QM92_9SPHN|nr:MAG: hypothetical protein DI555_07030 [Novosphingobium pentaromativorans]
MPSDLIRESERAAVISLKADAPLAEIIAPGSIDPVSENPAWPFVRLDGFQATLEGHGCSARSEIRFRAHSFAKPRYLNDDPKSGIPIETARDHAGRLNSAVVAALRNRAFTVDGRRYRFVVTNSILLQDGSERDTYHGMASVVARAYQG